MSYLLFFVAIFFCVYSALSGDKQYKVFQKLNNSEKRIAFFRRWILESWLYYGVFAVLALLLLGHASNLIHPIFRLKIAQLAADSSAAQSFAIGIGLGLAIVAVAIAIRSRKSSTPKKSVVIQKTSQLLPRNALERRYAAALAVSAGINEELFFRAALPVILVGVMHNAHVAVAISVLIFGFMHIYQGWQGVVGTTIVGLILMEIFLATGNIFIAMAVHAAIDLNSLVLIPLIAQRSAKKT